MDKEKLSKLYNYSTQEIHKLTTQLYEDVHDRKGDPSSDWRGVLDSVRKYKRLIIMELEAVKAALKEFAEANNLNKNE